MRKEDYFEFHFKYNNFTDKAKGCRQDWVICSHGKRLENFRNKEKNNQWDTKEIDLTQELKALCEDYKIEYEDSECFKNQLCQQDKSDFFKSLIRLLKLNLQMRNSKIGSDNDWLISPVKDRNGQFFDSRKADGDSMPKNTDANGAYHIALKGLLLLQQMAIQDEFKPDLSNKSWYAFIQGSNS